MKAVFINSLKQAKMNVSLSISQRQVVIKVLEKKNREKRFIKNWRPSLLLNVAIKTLSESLQENLNLFTIFFTRHLLFIQTKLCMLKTVHQTKW